MDKQDIISLCAHIAAECHYEQFRKGFSGKVPYVTHCFEVQKLLVMCGVTDSVTLCAALLHDIEEDGPSELDSLEFVFEDGVGFNEIKNLVRILTKKQDEKKEDYMKKFADCDIRAFHIKCADRICNVKDFYEDGNKEYAEKYFHKADILWKRLNMEIDPISHSLSKKLYVLASYHSLINKTGNRNDTCKTMAGKIW